MVFNLLNIEEVKPNFLDFNIDDSKKTYEIIDIQDDIKKKMLSYCVLSKTSEDIYVYSYKENEKIYDYVSFGGYIVSYRIFSVLLIKSIFYNFSMPMDRWDQLEFELLSLWKTLDLKTKENFNFIFAIKILKTSFKNIVEENNIEVFKELIKNIEERFLEERKRLEV